MLNICSVLKQFYSLKALNLTSTLSGYSSIAIALGQDHTCTIVTGGGLYCWGRNDYGQLGIGTSSTQYSPQNVGLGGLFKISSNVLFFRLAQHLPRAKIDFKDECIKKSFSQKVYFLQTHIISYPLLQLPLEMICIVVSFRVHHLALSQLCCSRLLCYLHCLGAIPYLRNSERGRCQVLGLQWLRPAGQL